MKNKIFFTLILGGIHCVSLLAQGPYKRCLMDSLVYSKYDILKYEQYEDLMWGFEYHLRDSLSDGLWILFKDCKKKYRWSRDTICYGSYKNGLKQGEFKYFNHVGYKIVNYKDGKREGRSFTITNGIISQEIFYVNDKINGPHIEYQKGLLSSVSILSNGKCISSTNYEPAGRLNNIHFNDSVYWFGETGVYRKAFYENFVLKKYIYYYENGQVKSEVTGEFIKPGYIGQNEFSGIPFGPRFIFEDLISGCWKFYNESGKLVEEDCK